MKDRMRFIVFVSAVIKNEKGEFLILKRSKNLSHHPSLWSIVSISIKSGESPESAVKRGVYEECGILINPIRIFQTYNFFYENDKSQEAVGFVYETNYISGNITLDLQKHSEYKWINSSEINSYVYTGTVKENLLEIAGLATTKQNSNVESAKIVQNKLMKNNIWNKLNTREKELFGILALRCNYPTDIQTLSEKFNGKVKGEDPSYTLIYKTISTLRKKIEPVDMLIISNNGGYRLIKRSG